MFALVCVLVCFGSVFSQEIIELSSQEAYEMAKKPSSYIIDVRSIAEYVFIGHPEMAYNIPYASGMKRSRIFCRMQLL